MVHVVVECIQQLCIDNLLKIDAKLLNEPVQKWGAAVDQFFRRIFSTNFLDEFFQRIFSTNLGLNMLHKNSQEGIKSTKAKQ
jgi:hypothetical protein